MNRLAKFGRRSVLLLAATAALVAGGAGDAVAQYNTATNEQCADIRDAGGNVDLSFAPNDPVRILSSAPANARCADPFAAVTITFSQSPAVVLGRITADANGRYDTSALGMRIPTDARNGDATISVITTVRGAPVTYTRRVTVAGAATGGGGAPRLPVTGRDLVMFTVWALALVAFGAVLISATWRRWQDAKQRSTSRPPTPVAPALTADPGEEFLTALRPASTRAMPLRGSNVATIDRPEVDAPPLVDPVGVQSPAFADFRERTGEMPSVPPIEETTTGRALDELPPTDDVRETVRRATTQTSEVVSRIQDEIRSWGRAND